MELKIVNNIKDGESIPIIVISDIKSFVKGYHTYKHLWNPVLNRDKIIGSIFAHHQSCCDGKCSLTCSFVLLFFLLHSFEADMTVTYVSFVYEKRQQ